MIGVNAKRGSRKTQKFLTGLLNHSLYGDLARYGQMGVDALARATPQDTGLTAGSWDYRIVEENGQIGIVWVNLNEAGRSNVAIMLQYGHGTGTGGYVQGRDYINPAIQPIFDQIQTDVWRRVTSV